MSLPTTLHEAFDILKSDLTPAEQIDIISMTKKDLYRMHNSLGRWIRNNWELWHNGPITIYFNSLGIYHADDMSGIIIESFWHHLRNEPLEIEQQVQFYKDFWAQKKEQK